MDTASVEQTKAFRRISLNAGWKERFASLLIGLVVVTLLAFGWLTRKSDYLDPENGWGYALGIIGGSMMLLLLVYPLRKRKQALKPIGSVGFWFRFHMTLGLFGPLAILYHSRFQWGALNSAMALWAMIIVASSGIVGRFLYSHTHRGYSERKLEMRELKDGMDWVLNELSHDGDGHATMVAALHDMEDKAIAAGKSFWAGARSVLTLGVETRVIEGQLQRQLDAEGGQGHAELHQALSEFFEAVRRSTEFAFYSRLMRLWHYLHLPLFCILVGASVLHIWAVHQY